MLERELKLHVPAASRPALGAALRQAGAAEHRLQAQYFDTQDNHLARHGIALRLRLEGGQWVQTAKGPGPDELTRVEINHPRYEATPALDLSVYDHTPLQHAFECLDQPLLLRYETVMTRHTLLHDTGRSHIELAFDTGVIRSGRLELPVCELELEQILGDPEDLFMLGRQWLQRYGLILDLRSKAERGGILANIALQPQADAAQAGLATPAHKLDHPSLLQAQHAEHVALAATMSKRQAYLHCINQCLSQIIRNAALLAGVEPLATRSDLHVEYVHQLRVGIRRLRACQQLFKKWRAIDEVGTPAELRQYFSILGHVRNNDVVRLTLEPRLRAAGMPDTLADDTADPSAPPHGPHALAFSTPFQLCLLALLEDLVRQTGLTVSSPSEVPGTSTETSIEALPEHGQPLGEALAKRLNKWLSQLSSQGLSFTQLTAEAQHTLRKKVKRLRYSLEFATGVLKTKRVAKIRAALNETQNILGELNDLYVAQDYYQSLSAQRPQALFALGWLKAMQTQKQEQAQVLFERLGRMPRLKARSR